ncbi:FxsA family protein [Acuticoccus sp.]|uniref:FxsA family protein n=1 Tax=Acuticoccus sp. TaxID=1904378 RepID=UPI003B5208ED
MIRTVLFLLLVLVPIAEIAVFLAVGSQIGTLATLGIIVATAIVGAILLRRQGLSALARLQSDLRSGRVPAAAIGHAIAVAVAGVLLLTPGFITDTVGLLLFVPAVRASFWRRLAGSAKLRVHPGSAPRGGPRSRSDTGRTIDLEATEVRTEDPSSPWRDGQR